MISTLFLKYEKAFVDVHDKTIEVKVRSNSGWARVLYIFASIGILLFVGLFNGGKFWNIVLPVIAFLVFSTIVFLLTNRKTLILIPYKNSARVNNVFAKNEKIKWPIGSTITYVKCFDKHNRLSGVQIQAVPPDSKPIVPIFQFSSAEAFITFLEAYNRSYSSKPMPVW